MSSASRSRFPGGADSQLLGGGCHCGRVRYPVRVRSWEALDCNCSICTKKGCLHLIVAPEDVILECGESALADYRFGSGVACHRFCRYCGVHPFYTPRSHPDCVDVNPRTLDGDVIGRFEVRAFDGRDWEKHVHEIRD